ncbi:telomerase activating protein Est1 [Purpureocillium lavendulum]|uniref:Nonsense-mediated mRNA decay factor n=1 Tax=Purpureocillium lavendulum TaxID=1247861 RepID=A0AB34G4G3_9HYPO|nr:telomerase activating protein Est1 [Purpureocillium lavendulum]
MLTHAHKIRKSIQRRLEKINIDNASETDASKFEAIDGLLEKLRLACVQTIFLDFKFATVEGVEEALWDTHVAINAEYRKVLKRPKNPAQAVERRKVEKMYHNFLRIAQKFYIGYIQRLAARYDIPELRRVAQGVNAEQMDSGDRISELADDMSRLVLQSCHSTLLHLGDLARYRIQAKQKSSGYEMALTYYNLARHIMPLSGFALHQIGIVNLDCGNHLDVVYNFYRSRVSEIPHPNAKANLENEFKTLRKPKADKGRRSPSTPQDAFSSWFVKLHALFYQGELFSQHEELEHEVMHRLDMACRDATTSGTLLKMAVVNICAYDVASTTYAEKKTEGALRYSQFALRFNTQFLSRVCRTLESTLREAISSRDQGVSGCSDVEITPVVGSLLPILRIYCVWVASRRHHLFGQDITIGPPAQAMLQNLAKVFTQLCVVSYTRKDLASAPYLLPEDLEIRGVPSLTGDQVPADCRVYCVDGAAQKPYGQDPERRLGDLYESLARILDVLRCAYFLAEDQATPLSCSIIQDSLVFECQSETTATPTEHTVPALPSGTGAQTSRAPAPHPPTQTWQGEEQAPVPDRNAPLAQPMAGSAIEEQTEQTVMAMLSPFLGPPTPHKSHHTRRPSSPSSYGMHTDTANEVFGSVQTAASPQPVATAGSISPYSPYPWAWNDMPKPQGHMAEAFNRTGGGNSPREPVGEADQGDLRRSEFLDAEPGEPLTHVDGRLEGLAFKQAGQEATGKRVTSTVGVVDLLRLDGVDGELLDALLTLDGDKSGLRALRDNSNALALLILLGKVGQMDDDVLGLLGRQVVGLGVRRRLGLVANDVVPPAWQAPLWREGRLFKSLTKVARCGKERHMVLTSEVEATNVVDLGVLDELPDLRLLQVVDVIVVGSAQVGAQAAVVAGDDDAAAASLLLGVDAVLDAQTSGLDSIVQDGRVLVVTSTAQIDDAVGGQDVLRTTGRVLCSAAGNELGVVVVQQLLVQRDVLLLGKNGVVGLQLVLVQQGLIADSLDICIGGTGKQAGQ